MLASHKFDYIAYGSMGTAIGASFGAAFNEYYQGNLGEAAKYAMLGFWFSLPLALDGAMRLGVSYRKRHPKQPLI
jgi:hypothetical protein